MGSKKYNNLNDCVVDAKNGVDGAFDALYSMSYPYAYSASAHLLKKREDIEDALQSSFYYVARHISGLRDTSAYLKWLNRIVINECKKILLEQNKHKKIFYAEKNRIIMSDIAEDTDDIQIEKTDLVETVSGIIESMKPEKREILKLYYFENLSYSEISEKLGIPIGTVMSRLYNAKKELEKKVKELKDDGTVLWSLPILPFVAALLSYNIKAQVSAPLLGQAVGGAISASASAAVASGSAGVTGTAAAASGAAGAGTAAATVGTSVAAKAVAVALAASVAVGGGAVTKNIVDRHRAQAELTASETEQTVGTANDELTEKINEIFESRTRRSDSRGESAVTEDFTRESAESLAADEGISETVTAETETSDENTSERPAGTVKAAVPPVSKRAERTRRSDSLQSTTSAGSSHAPSSQAASQAVTSGVSTTAAEVPTTRKRMILQTTGAAKSNKADEKTTSKPAESSSPQTTAAEKDSADDFSVSGGVLNGYSGSGGKVSIPSTLNGQAVTAIGAGAFEGADITSVSVPSGVTKIGQMSFSDCSSLSSVSLPSTLTSIGDCAFDGCSSLKSVTIPDSVTNIGDDAFDGCDNLTIRCREGSAAYNYAVENDIDYELI